MYIVRVLIFLFYCCSQVLHGIEECSPACAKSTTPANCLDSSKLCFDCEHTKVAWTFKGGRIPPNVCLQDGKLWAKDEDISSALNSGIYQCRKNSSTSNAIIKAFNFSVNVVKTKIIPENEESSFKCPLEFCVSKCSWTFAKSLEEKFTALPACAVIRKCQIRIEKAKKDCSGFFKCIITPRNETLPMASRIVKVHVLPPSDTKSARFTNCERVKCASHSGANQRFTCAGKLSSQPGNAVVLNVACTDIGHLKTMVISKQHRNQTNGRLTLVVNPTGDNEFQCSAIVGNVTSNDQGIQCNLTIIDHMQKPRRSFSLCVDEQPANSATLVAVCILLLLALTIVLLFYCWYPLRFCWRRLVHDRHFEPLLMNSQHIVLIYSRHRQEMARSLARDLSASFSHVTCHLILEGLAGQDVGDNVQKLVNAAEIVVVLLERCALNETTFLQALTLSLERPHLSRVYVWNKDLTLSQIEHYNTRLGKTLRADLDCFCNRDRCVTWRTENSLPRSQLVLRLKLILPVWAVV